MLQKFFNILNRDMQDADQMAENGLLELKKKRELTIGVHKVKIDRKIAEGGYADIYRVIDASGSQSFFSNAPKSVFALKRQFIETNSQQIDFTNTVSKNSVEQAYICEINSLKNVKESQNVIKLVDHQENLKSNGFEVYMLLEYCPNGTLFDLIEQKCRNGYSGITDEDELIKIVNDIAKGLKALHEKSISHRDLKIENVLKS